MSSSPYFLHDACFYWTKRLMHHQKMRRNYGLYANLWDRLMGTNHHDYESRFREVTSRPSPQARP